MNNLKGTEKQIKWANDIRGQWLEQLNDVDTNKDYTEKICRVCECKTTDIKLTIEYVNSLESAEEIINIRHKDFKDLIRENKKIEIDEKIIEMIKKINTMDNKEMYIERAAQLIQRENFYLSRDRAIQIINRILEV